MQVAQPMYYMQQIILKVFSADIQCVKAKSRQGIMAYGLILIDSQMWAYSSGTNVVTGFVTV